jgi:hypothetical protein
VVRGAVARAGGVATAEPSWLPSAAGAVHSNTVGGPARGRWGCGPGGPDAGRASSPCRCPRPASGVQCPVRADSVHACLSTRRCPVPGAGVRASSLGVRCPAWASGVRALPRPRCPTGCGREGGGGRAAAWLGGPGSAWSPAGPMAGSSAARVGTWRSRLAPAVLGQRRRRLGLGRRRGRWLGSGWVDRVADQEGPGVRQDRHWQVSRGAQRGGDYAAWSSWTAQGRVAWSPRASRAGLRPGRAAVLRPQARSERRPLAAVDALTCDVWGWR